MFQQLYSSISSSDTEQVAEWYREQDLPRDPSRFSFHSWTSSISTKHQVGFAEELMSQEAFGGKKMDV